MARRNGDGRQPEAPVAEPARYISTPAEIACELNTMLDRAMADDWRLITTGVAEIDDALTIYPGSVSAVVGRPGMGKSMLLKALAKRELVRIGAEDKSGKQCVVYVTLEEPETKLAIQLAGSSLEWRAMARGEIGDADEARRQIAGLPKRLRGLYVIRHPGLVAGHVAEPLSAETVMGAIERIATEFGRKPTLVCLDYLQLMKGDAQSYTVRDKMEHVMAASAGALNLARALQVPVVMAVQASREADNREPPLPRMSDMQWASSIEQDCDNVIGLCRPISLPSVQDQIAQVGSSTVPICGVSHAVTETLMLLVVIKARNDGSAGRRFAAHLHPTGLTMHGIDHHA
jgi:replicative DNA helicase